MVLKAALSSVQERVPAADASARTSREAQRDAEGPAGRWTLDAGQWSVVGTGGPRTGGREGGRDGEPLCYRQTVRY